MIWPARICAIEIAPTEVKAVVVRQRGGSAKVLTLARQPIEQSEDEDPRERAIRALERLMDDNDLSADVYTGCLPVTSAIVRPLQVPFAGRRRVSAALKYEMEPVVPFPIDELIVDYMPIQQNDKKTTDVLAVGMRTETVRFHLEVLEAVGLDPDRLDLDAAGLTNLWRAALRGDGSGADGMSLMVHVQDTSAYFVALDGRAPVFLRAMNFGADALRTGSPMAAEELMATVRSVSASAGGSSFSELVVTGITLDRHVLDDLTERLAMPVRCVQTLVGSSISGLSEHAAAAAPNYWEPMVGLAADSGRRDWMRFNFRKEDLAQTLISPELQRRAMFTSALLGVLVLVGILSSFKNLQDLRTWDEELNRQIVSVYESTLPKAQKLPAEKIPKAMKDMVEKMATDRVVEPFVARAPMALHVLDDLSGCIPQDESSVEVTRFELKAGIVRLSGLTADAAVVGQIKMNMDASDSFEEVTIERQEDIRRRGEQKVDFSITAKLKQKSS